MTAVGQAGGRASERPVVVVGDLNADLVIRVPDGTADTSDAVPQLYGGGTAGNVAAGLGRLGVPTRIVAAVGDDTFGRRLVEDLEDDGVGTAGVRYLGDAFTPLVIALIRSDGDRVTLVWPPERGADVLLTPGHLDHHTITTAGWLHTSGLSLRHRPVRDAVFAAMELAADAGVPVSLDLNLRAELWGMDDDVRRAVDRAIALADVVLGSGPDEILPLAAALSPSAHDEAAGDTAIERAVRALADGRRMVVARLAADGALAVSASPGEPGSPDRRGTIRAPGFRTTVVDTVGAGDAFDAGFICASREGRGVDEALRWGNAVAALSVAGHGARALPHREHVEDLLSTP